MVKHSEIEGKEKGREGLHSCRFQICGGEFLNKKVSESELYIEATFLSEIQFNAQETFMVKY